MYNDESFYGFEPHALLSGHVLKSGDGCQVTKFSNVTRKIINPSPSYTIQSYIAQYVHNTDIYIPDKSCA